MKGGKMELAIFSAERMRYWWVEIPDSAATALASFGRQVTRKSHGQRKFSQHLMRLKCDTTRNKLSHKASDFHGCEVIDP
jgi:hypothetical protein